MTQPPPDESIVIERVGALRELIRGIRGDDNAVRIVAVTTTFDESAFVLAARAACDGVGENYAQELLDKLARLGDRSTLPVHFIGHLQSNKVKALFPHVALWHTVDRASAEGDRVVVSSAEVPRPVAARYAWENFPTCNLFNGAGLPASPHPKLATRMQPRRGGSRRSTTTW